jgi:hypothetical protein
VLEELAASCSVANRFLSGIRVLYLAKRLRLDIFSSFAFYNSFGSLGAVETPLQLKR